MEAGRHLATPESTTHLVLIGVDDQEELLDIRDYLNFKGVQHHLFFEPDDDMGYSSQTTEPIEPSNRKIFQHFKLYKGD